MFHAISPMPRLEGLALALACCVACSPVGSDAAAHSAELASTRLATAASVEAPAPKGPFAAPAAAALGNGRSARTSPVQVLEQLVTTQALLVSLLLTPLAKDGSEEPVARVDMSRNATSEPLP